jgi:cytochrome c556
MKIIKSALISIIVLFFACGILWAGGVVPTGMDDPAAVVQARKAAMHAIKMNMEDIKAKLKGKKLKSIQANAKAVDVMARVLPPLYKEVHKDAYDGKGAFYKGAPATEIEAISGKMSDAAQAMFSAAGAENKSDIAAGMGSVYQTCGMCHKKYQGKF